MHHTVLNNSYKIITFKVCLTFNVMYLTYDRAFKSYIKSLQMSPFLQVVMDLCLPFSWLGYFDRANSSSTFLLRSKMALNMFARNNSLRES